MENIKKLYIMRGLPGSGKNWYVDNQILSKFPDAVVCSADDYHMINGVYAWKAERSGYAHNTCKNKFFLAVRAGKPVVVVNNTNTTVKEMNDYYKTARECGYDVEIVHMDVPVSVSSVRNVHSVPLESISRMNGRFASVPSDWIVSETRIDNG
jgi:predicted kinase